MFNFFPFRIKDPDIGDHFENIKKWEMKSDWEIKPINTWNESLCTDVGILKLHH